MQGEFFLDPNGNRHTPWLRKLGEACAKLFRAPTPEEIEQRRRAEITNRWEKNRRKGFIVVPSAEGSLSTPEQVRGLYPAGSLTLNIQNKSSFDCAHQFKLVSQFMPT